jgi:hypothetical protein
MTMTKINPMNIPHVETIRRHTMTTITHTHNRKLYTWTPVHTPRTLYGVPLLPQSLIPDGLVMTLVNVEGASLTLRGELIGETIRFTHLAGEGGQWIIGVWTPSGLREKVAAFPERPSWAQKLYEVLA